MPDEVVAPPEVPIPPPPEDVAYPRTPVITVDAPDDVTMAPTVGEDALKIPPHRCGTTRMTSSPAISYRSPSGRGC